MQHIKSTFIIVFLLLTSCTSIELNKDFATHLEQSELAPSIPVVTHTSTKTEIEADNKPVICYDVTDDESDHTPIDTGVLREAPIDIMSHKLFVHRLKTSPLWSKVNYSTPSQRNFLLESINGMLTVGGIGYKLNQINRIHYTPLNERQRNQHGHQLLEQERFAMTEVINIVIDNRVKSENILEQLYQQYLVKVENNETLSNNETFHTYVRYDGMLFQMWGITRNNHRTAKCNFEMITALVIN